MVSHKHRLRQSISWDHKHTNTHTQNSPSLSLWRVRTVHLHIHFSLTLVLSLSLIFSDHLILNCYHIWFNYSTSALNLLHLSLSLCSTGLFALFSSWTLKRLWSTVSLSFSHHLACCSPSNIQAPPPRPNLPHHLFLCCYSLPHPLSFSFSLSDLLWECYLYSNNPRRVEQSRAEQSSEGSLTCQSGHHLRNTNKTLLSFNPSMATPLRFFIFASSNACSSHS